MIERFFDQQTIYSVGVEDEVCSFCVDVADGPLAEQHLTSSTMHAPLDQPGHAGKPRCEAVDCLRLLAAALFPSPPPDGPARVRACEGL